MAEPQNPRGRDGNGDDIVAAAFASYRSGAPKHFDPPPAGVVMADVVPPPRRRAFTLTMAGLAFTGLMVAGVAVAQTLTLPQSDDPGVVGAESSSDTGNFDQSQTSQQPDDSSTTAPTEPDPVETELLSWSISLPDWPGKLAERCPAGEYTFEPYDAPDGTTSNKPSSPTPTDERLVDWETWALLPAGTHAVVTDLDGEEGDEVIVPVACGDVPGVIALYQDEKSFGTVEFVYAGTQQDEPIDVASVSDSVVTLSFPAEESGIAQLREFTFDGEQFTETTDPSDEPQTDEPSDSPSDEPSSPSPSEPDDETPGDGGDSSESDASQTNGGSDKSRSLEYTTVPG